MNHTPPPNFNPIYFQDYIFKHVLTSRLEKGVDPDQLASQKPADLDLHFLKHDMPGLSMVRVNHQI